MRNFIFQFLHCYFVSSGKEFCLQFPVVVQSKEIGSLNVRFAGDPGSVLKKAVFYRQACKGCECCKMPFVLQGYAFTCVILIIRERE
jgi:hypothetical protein